MLVDTHDNANEIAIPSYEDLACNKVASMVDMKEAFHTCKDIMASCKKNQQRKKKDSFHRKMDGIIVAMVGTSMKDGYMAFLQRA